MVLEDTDPTSSDGYSGNDSTQTWMNNANEDGDGKKPRLYDLSIRPEDVPRPVFLDPMSPGWALTNERYVATLHPTLEVMAKMIQRPLTTAESDFILYQEAKAIRTSSWGSLIGFYIATGRAMTTDAKFKANRALFQQLEPKPSVFSNPAFFFQALPNPLKWNGIKAMARIGLWGFSGAILGRMVATFYAASVFTAHMKRDPNMKDLNQRMEKMQREKRSPEHMQPYPQKPRAGMYSETQGEASQDDMSPTSSSGADYGYQASDSRGAAEFGQVRQPQSLYANSPRPTPVRPQQPASEWMDDMDASPVAKEEPQQTGSAWDRVRARQGASGPNRPDARRQIQQRENPSNDRDSFSFSKRDEERQLAKSQQQQEFDARVERERQGKDF